MRAAVNLYLRHRFVVVGDTDLQVKLTRPVKPHTPLLTVGGLYP